MTAGEEIEQALTAHLAWSETFRAAIASNACSDVILAHAESDDLCAFGQWLYGQDDEIKASAAYQRVKDCHYVFHVEAGIVARYLLARDFAAADAACKGAFAGASAALQRALDAWRKALLAAPA
jgi:hypothetical protein